MRRCMCLVLGALMLTGCASLEGRRVFPPDPPYEEGKPDGLTYYLTRPAFSVDIKETRNKKKAEPVFDIRMRPEPDPEQRYEVWLKGGAFSNDTLSLTLLDDGRVAKVGVAAESQVGPVVRTLGKVVASVMLLKAGGAPLALAVGAESGDFNLTKTALNSAATECRKDEQGQCMQDNAGNDLMWITPEEKEAATGLVSWLDPTDQSGMLPQSKDAQMGFRGTVDWLVNSIQEYTKAKDEVNLKFVVGMVAAVGRVWKEYDTSTVPALADRQTFGDTLKGSIAFLGQRLEKSANDPDQAALYSEILQETVSIWMFIVDHNNRPTGLFDQAKFHSVAVKVVNGLSKQHLAGDVQTIKVVCSVLDTLGEIWIVADDQQRPPSCLYDQTKLFEAFSNAAVSLAQALSSAYTGEKIEPISSVFNTLGETWMIIDTMARPVSTLATDPMINHAFLGAARILVENRTNATHVLDAKTKEQLDLLSRAWTTFVTDEKVSRSLSIEINRLLLLRLDASKDLLDTANIALRKLEAWTLVSTDVSADNPAADLQRVEKAISTVESWVKDSLFRDQKLSIAEEPAGLVAHTVLGNLRQIKQVLLKEIKKNSPEEVIKQSLKDQHKEAAKAYAARIKDPNVSAKPLEDYAAMIDRLLEYEANLLKPVANNRKQQLNSYFNKVDLESSDGNKSKAYKDYRAELDLIVQRINARLNAYLKSAEKDALPKATEVTRKLEETMTCRISGRDDLSDDGNKILSIADLWIEFSEVEAIVFISETARQGNPKLATLDPDSSGCWR